MSKQPTVDDVARAAGVSRQTVSNVLNSPAIVREETRARVSAAIEGLGYRPHASARRLRTRTSSTIGIRLDPAENGISNSILDRFLHALTSQAAERRMRIMLFTADDRDDELGWYERLHDGADVDAFVLSGTIAGDPRIDWLAAHDIPFVSFGRPWGERDDAHDASRRWVDVDGAAGTAQATRHLVERGLTRIGFLGWPGADWGTGAERRRGWAETMTAEFGLDADALTALTLTATEAVARARQAVEPLAAHGLGAGGLEALVCASDSLALGAMMAVREAGHPRFPVIGFDNTPVAQAVGLSSVDQRLDAVAEQTLHLLMGDGQRVLRAGDVALDAPTSGLVVPKLVVRRSSHLAPVDEAGTSGDHSEDKKESI